MDDQVMLTLQNQGQSKLVIADRGSTYEDIVGQAIVEWNQLNVGSFYFTFDVDGVVNCALKSQQDLNNLLLLCKHKGEKFVYVNVKAVGTDPQRFAGELALVNSADAAKVAGRNCLVSQTAEEGLFPARVGKDNKRCGRPMAAGKVRSPAESVLPTYDVAPHLTKKVFVTDSWKGCIQQEGQYFRGGAAEFRYELIKFTEKNGTGFDYVRNEKDYIYAVCKEKENRSCDWFVKGKRIKENDLFVIYKLNLVHKCVGSTVGKFKSRLGAAILGREFKERVRQDPTATGADIKAVLLSSYGLDVSYSRAWRGREAARGEIFGSFRKSFNELKWYEKAIVKTNPGSIVSLHNNKETKAFEKMFVAFNALIEGFKSCRPMLFIDGAHLSGRLKGCILTATTKDANNGLFPVAFVVVTSETLENWKWFLENLRDGIKHDKEILYVSVETLGSCRRSPRCLRNHSTSSALYTYTPI